MSPVKLRKSSIMKVQASSIDFSGDNGIKLRQQNSHFHPEHHNELKTLEQDFED
jgi:hypothetical protein